MGQIINVVIFCDLEGATGIASIELEDCGPFCRIKFGVGIGVLNVNALITLCLMLKVPALAVANEAHQVDRLLGVCKSAFQGIVKTSCHDQRIGGSRGSAPQQRWQGGQKAVECIGLIFLLKKKTQCGIKLRFSILASGLVM